MANCEDVSARMVELLYGELPADARSGVDAHVAGCARCRSELQGLEKTRAVTRQALDESPPPRARAEILRRAAEHLAAQQPSAAAAAAAPIVPANKPKKAAPEQSGLWDWLRSRWTVPSLATVGAVALLVIGSRVLLEPANVDYEGSPEFQREARQAAAPAASPPPAEIAPPPAPGKGESPAADKDTAAQPAEAVAAAADSRSEEEIAGNGHGAKLASPSRRSRAKAEEKVVALAPPRPTTSTSGPLVNKQVERDRGDEGRFAPPPPPKPVTGFKMDSDDARATSTPTQAARHRSGSAPSDGAHLDELLGGGKASAAAKPGGLGAGSSVGGYTGGGKGERSVAKEHAPRETPAPRMAEPAAAPPPAAAMPPPAASPMRQESEKKAKKRAADDETAAGADEGKPATKSKASADTAAERANRLFTDGRWAEAAAAYRELLRRDPNNADAPRWRQRMAVAEAALESRRPTEPRTAPAP
jgi:hypothetical protein